MMGIDINAKIEHEINYTTVLIGHLMECLINKGIVTKSEMEEVSNKAMEQYKIITDLLRDDKK